MSLPFTVFDYMLYSSLLPGQPSDTSHAFHFLEKPIANVGTLSPWYSPSSDCRWKRWHPDVQSGCEYIKQSKTAHKGLSSRLGVGQGTTTPSPLKTSLLQKLCRGLRLLMAPLHWIHVAQIGSSSGILLTQCWIFRFHERQEFIS